MNDHADRIKRTSDLVRWAGLPEVLDYSAVHVVSAILVWRPPHGQAAIYNAPAVCGVRRFKIKVWSFLNVSERGHSLVHELFHIPFALAGLPKTSELAEGDFWLLEDSIEQLAVEAISENPAMPAQIWESLFGFRIDEFTR